MRRAAISRRGRETPPYSRNLAALGLLADDRFAFLHGELQTLGVHVAGVLDDEAGAISRCPGATMSGFA